jgi:glycosyltransferase involved in cell wall biosynthesis
VAPIRVLRILNRTNLGGPVYNATFLSALMDSNFETLLISGVPNEDELEYNDFVTKYNIKYKQIEHLEREISLSKDYKAFKEIRKIVKEFKPHIIHTHAAKAGLVGRLVAIYSRTPIILHTFHGHVFHNYFGKLKTKFYILLERFLAKYSTGIITISALQKNELVKLYKIASAKKTHLIPLGLDLDAFYTDQVIKRKIFREKFLIKEDEIVIGIVGRLVPIKNHRLFINAINEVLKTTTKKIRVLIIGDGDERENIMQQLAQLNILYNYFPENVNPQTVTLTSWLTKMDEVFAGLDIVALTSLNEGTPVSLIEAQAACKPIVTTNVGGVSDIVLENDTAFITPTEDVGAFTKALLQLIEDDVLRNEMGKNGYDQVKNKFDKMRLVNDMQNLYNKLLEEKGLLTKK